MAGVDANLKLTNADYQKSARAITVRVWATPGLTLWWRARTWLAVRLVRLGCRVGGMRFETGEKP